MNGRDESTPSKIDSLFKFVIIIVVIVIFVWFIWMILPQLKT